MSDKDDEFPEDGDAEPVRVRGTPPLPEGRRRRSKGSNQASKPMTPARKDLAQRVKTARGRKLSSTRWLQRQLNDPYVQRAKDLGYRSRAAFKLTELDEQFRLLKPGQRVADLGCAPGGWCQVARNAGAARVVGVDLLPVEPIDDVILLEGDFTDPAVVAAVTAALGGPCDVVLSDMAANTTGHRATDHLRIVALVEAAALFAEATLNPGGAFVAKVFQGGADGALLERVKARFAKVRHAKPPASRPGSPETYLVATGFRP